ncbi:hypothetical protein V9K67_05635 [Paraflavisolibacter sp. H34]|uniref:hypothetical protein n=1 Tax=Huijunlia imazamoxiresistens TaxID=3127457 RepID=UPI00301693A8
MNVFRPVLDCFDLRFYTRFALLFLGLYGLYTFIIGATTPSGTYYPCIDRYFNFPEWIRTSVLYGGHQILSFLEIESFVTSDSLVNGEVSRQVRMGWPCYGLMNKSFWLAYVIAHAHPLKNKIFWSLAGIGTIWLINCCRIAVLYIALTHNWSIGPKLNTNNHELFNYVSYVFLLLLLLLHHRKSSSRYNGCA